MTFGSESPGAADGQEAETLRSPRPEGRRGIHLSPKVENGKLDFGDYPSEALIRKLQGAWTPMRPSC